MYLRLIRKKPQGRAIFGRLYVDGQQVVVDTLENLQYAIPSGFYRLRLTYSPRFKELLPVLDHVIGYARDPHNGVARTGIRIHAGNTIADTTGCILLGTADVENSRLLSSRQSLHTVREYLFTYQTMNPYEEMYIEITEPDWYPDADMPCPRELQQHIIDGQQTQARYQQYLQDKRRQAVGG